jgi:hypothetical protein
MNQRRVRAGIRFLEQAGLNLVAVLDCAALPETTAQIMRESGVPLDACRRLVLLGHGGKRMWQALQLRLAPATGCSRALSAPTAAWREWPAPTFRSIVTHWSRSGTIRAALWKR